MSHPAREPIVFVLRHTHWDREWYQPAVVFRKRLVDMIDGLLDERPNAPFLLDGQAVALSDYVAARPERTAELAMALHDGRIEAGPWFVLPDELIPSGEALVRNLLAGRRVLRALRATAPDVLYCPDSFGHPAALPTIASGFGCGTIVLWRGYGSRRFPPGDAAMWTAPNGDRALLFHLPPDGYEFGSNLPAADADARTRWDAMRRVLEPRSALGIWLVPNGADHHAPQLAGETAVAALTRAASPLRIQQGRLQELGALLLQRSRDAALPQVQGELRDSYGYTWTLPGTLAARAYQKRRNATIERCLIRDVEPWNALARIAGRPSARQHVQRAWETLLCCHPHDSLGGCSIDAVAQSVDARMADAAALAAELRESCLAALVGHDADAARAHASAWHAAVLVRNRAARSRGGIAELFVDVPIAHVPVGPGSAGRRREVPAFGALTVPTQVIASERRYARIEAPRFYPVNHEVERRRSLAWLPAVSGYGVVALPLSKRSGSEGVPAAAAVSDSARGIYSALGSLTSGRGGPLWRAAGSRTSRAFIAFETATDRGDTYTPSIAPGKARSATPLRSRVALRGPLRGAIDTTWRFAPSAGRPRVRIALQSRVALDAGANFIRVSVSGTNGATHNRLRILFATGLRPRTVLADAAFAFVERKPLQVPAVDRRAETPLPTAPLQRFVSIFEQKRGCTIVSDGLAEYEVLRSGQVAITLVRSVGELSRADLPERPGHAGWPAATPGAQCPGPFAAEFAIAWHGGDSPATRAAIVALADDVLLPLTGDTRRDLVALPAATAGISLEGEGLVFSSLKESEDGEHVVARCVNVTDREIHGAWHLPLAISGAQHGRLDETAVAPLPPSGTRIPIVVPPFAVDTLLIPLSGAR